MKNDKLDLYYRNAMLVCGILTAVLFILSLVAMIEFPKAFKYLAIGMISSALIFLILKSLYGFRMTYKIKEKNKATHK